MRLNKERRSASHIETLEPRRMMSVHFQDGTFLPANWTIIPVTLTQGGTTSAVQTKKGGHGGAFRTVTTNVNGALPGESAGIFGFHEYAKGLYDPAKKGAIVKITYSEDAILLSGFGQGQGTGPALIQNGTVYFGKLLTLITPSTKWTHKSLTGLTAADFTNLDETEHPDFSKTAPVMQFGFYRANGTGIGGGGYTIVGGIDNWSITISSSKK